jgi:hypothetical protein
MNGKRKQKRKIQGLIFVDINIRPKTKWGVEESK